VSKYASLAVSWIIRRAIMGFFDWLTGAKTKVPIEDRIWLTKQAKFFGIQRDIAQALADPNGPDTVLVVAHFPNCFDELQSMVTAAGFDEGCVLEIPILLNAASSFRRFR
jgi:hypothetical protein